MFILLLCLGAQPLKAQDTLVVRGMLPTEEDNTNYRANKAVRWSLLPGAGQIYNGQAWKVPIIYGAFAVAGYFVYENYTSMALFKEEYLYRVNVDDAGRLEEYKNYPTSYINDLYNSYNRNFQLMIIVCAGIYALNLVDAYVFGHLYDFQIDDNISMNVAPTVQATPLGFYPSVGLRLSF